MMIYKYQLHYEGLNPQDQEDLDKTFTTSIPVEIGHHIERVHSVYIVKAILHNLFDDNVRLVITPISSVEDYGISNF
jgi:hypothetical protein